MKVLLIMRHAKSSWDDLGLSDHDRPLNNRGEKDAPKMGKLLKQKNLIPDIIISSSAKRAHMTAKKVAKSCGYKKEIVLQASFYSANPGTYINELYNIGKNNIKSIMLVGHNPGLEELVEYLTGIAESLPTCALVHIKLPINGWNELRNKPKGELINIWRPKELN